MSPGLPREPVLQLSRDRHFIAWTSVCCRGLQLCACRWLLPSCSPAPLRDPGDCGDSCTALGTHGQGCRRHVKLDLITVRCQFLQTRRSRRPLPCW